MRAIGIKEFLDRKFDVYPFEGKFFDSFGEPEKNAKFIIYGKPGNGKTEFCIQLTKYLSRWARVYFNSFEQGISKSLQDALVRNQIGEVNGKVIFGDKETVDEMHQRLAKKNSPRVVIIDSRDYMNMTTEQFKKLIERFKRKIFIVVCWESNQKPKGEYAKAIEFMCDVKIRVVNFEAIVRSRFGGNKNFVIWEGRRNNLRDLFNQDTAKAL